MAVRRFGHGIFATATASRGSTWSRSITALLFAAFVSGDALATYVPGDNFNEELTHDGESRLYDIYLPSNFDGITPVALVLDLHGLNGNKTDHANLSGFKTLAESEGFIVAHPQGLFGLPGDPEVATGSIYTHPWDELGPSWNSGNLPIGNANAAGIDDVGFLRALVVEIASRATIDSARVYVTGFSNGSGMTQRLACEAGDIFAAFAGFAAPILFEPITLCAPTRAIPMYVVQGLTDIVVPYAGGPGLGDNKNPTAVSAQDNFAYWRDIGGCVDSVVIENGVCEVHDSCTDGVEVTLCSVTGTCCEGVDGHFVYLNSDGLQLASQSYAFMSQFILRTCRDGIQNQGETELDCGGTNCPSCDAVVCDDSPEPVCNLAARAAIHYDEKKPGKEKMKLQWKKIADATTQNDFGDPVSGTTTVALCIYDDADTLVRQLILERAGDQCAGKPCWAAKGTSGYGYKDKDNATDGISKLSYKAGGPAKGKADAKGKNNWTKGQTELPTGVVARLAGSVAPTIQVLTNNGLCIGATMNAVRKDEGKQYKAQKK